MPQLINVYSSVHWPKYSLDCCSRGPAPNKFHHLPIVPLPLTASTISVKRLPFLISLVICCSDTDPNVPRRILTTVMYGILSIGNISISIYWSTCHNVLVGS